MARSGHRVPCFARGGRLCRLSVVSRYLVEESLCPFVVCAASRSRSPVSSWPVASRSSPRPLRRPSMPLRTPRRADAQTGIPTFSWDRVAGATTYDFQISASDQFTSDRSSTSPPSSTSTCPRSSCRPGPAVLAGRGHGAGRAWTTHCLLPQLVGAPTLIAPADEAELTQPDSRSSSPGSPSRVRTRTRCSTAPTRTSSTRPPPDGRGLVLRRPAPDSWHLRGGSAVSWPTASSPVLLRCRPHLPGQGSGQRPGRAADLPAGRPGFAITDVVLDWEPIKGAKTYELQISTDQLFAPANIVDQQNTVYGTRYSPTKTLGNDQYFWRIRATDAAGFQPAWSSRPVWRFKRDLVRPAELRRYPPDNGPHRRRPVLLPVGQVKHASHYEVQLSSGVASPRRPFPSVHHGPHHAGLRRRHGQLLARPRRAPTPGGSWPGTSSPTPSRSPTGSLAPVGRSVQPGAGHDHRSRRRDRSSPTPRTQPRREAADPGWNPVGRGPVPGDHHRPTNKTVTTSALSYSPRDLAPGNYPGTCRPSTRWAARRARHR